ncbi:uncharacterized protein RHOBADRAFT_55195 [Rhodotorula graminis WP1]|uniref:Uncharacterized protein n=1 Tax=Rhodotorula graminis (strain WP1) TaxID=578459 RepID=A0A0P9F1H8_RHOGW|nr:uncharacterized protein RHOBADRAFT_55195 [Rhodotorula graminis WP1]KPV73459.1 hypothetical protein RHOBADRAFT_55195 [Rhodotorula graminis WP1]
MSASSVDSLAVKRDRLLADNVDPNDREALLRRRAMIDHALAELDPNAVLDLSAPLSRKNHEPLDNLMHLADLDRQELDVYRTEYPDWWRLARQSTEETRNWRRSRRERWAQLREQQAELSTDMRSRAPHQSHQGALWTAVSLAWRSVALGGVVSLAVVISLAAWLVLRSALKVDPVMGRERVWLQYGQHKPPYALVQLDQRKYSTPGKVYDVDLELVVPVNSNNLELGNFMATS